MDRRHFIAGASGVGAAAATGAAQAGTPGANRRAAAMAAVSPAVIAGVAALRFRLQDALNTKDFAAFADTFAPDGVWELPGVFTLVGREAIASRIAAMIKSEDWLIQGYQGDAVLSATATRAHARAYFTEYGFRGGAPHFVVGVYDEICVRQGGVWRYAKRTSNLSYRGPADLTGKPARLATPPAPDSV